MKADSNNIFNFDKIHLKNELKNILDGKAEKAESTKKEEIKILEK